MTLPAAGVGSSTEDLVTELEGERTRLLARISDMARYIGRVEVIIEGLVQQHEQSRFSMWQEKGREWLREVRRDVL
jgi:hypothetical protein